MIVDIDLSQIEKDGLVFKGGGDIAMAIVDVDLSQIEWRVAAFLSQDKVMMDEIRNGVDQHAAACTDIMELPLTSENRTDAKIFNFRAIYCDENTGWYGFYMDNKMPDFSKDKWKDIVNNFFTKYNGLLRWHNRIVNEVRNNGQLRGPTGRIWRFKKYKQKGGYYDYSKAQIYNYPVQGTAGDIIKLVSVITMKRLQYLDLKKIIMIVHDSMIFDVSPKLIDDVIEICLQTMEETPQLLKKYFDIDFNVPITGEAKVGASWGTTEKYKIN